MFIRNERCIVFTVAYEISYGSNKRSFFNNAKTSFVEKPTCNGSLQVHNSDGSNWCACIRRWIRLNRATQRLRWAHVLGVLHNLGKCRGDFDEFVMYIYSSLIISQSLVLVLSNMPRSALTLVFLVLADETVLQRLPNYFLMFCIYGSQDACYVVEVRCGVAKWRNCVRWSCVDHMTFPPCSDIYLSQNLVG